MFGVIDVLVSATFVRFDVFLGSFTEGDSALVLRFSCVRLGLDGWTFGRGMFESTSVRRSAKKLSSAFVFIG